LNSTFVYGQAHTSIPDTTGIRDTVAIVSGWDLISFRERGSSRIEISQTLGLIGKVMHDGSKYCRESDAGRGLFLVS